MAPKKKEEEVAEEEVEEEKPVEVIGPDEFTFPETNSVYNGQYYIPEAPKKAEEEENEEDAAPADEEPPAPVPHGHGVWTVGPEKYVGTFEHGQFVEGKYMSRNRHFYEGQFQDNKFHGQGTYTWADGRVYKGEFKEGRLHECEGSFENFVTVDELHMQHLEKELNLGRMLLQKEVDQIWTSVDLKSNHRNIEFGRDVFTGISMDNEFFSNKQAQAEIRAAIEEAKAAAAAEAEEGGDAA